MKFPAVYSRQSSLCAGENIYILTLLTVLVLKVAALAYWGPGFAPDSGGYVNYADLILRDAKWLNDARLDSSMMPTTVFRMIGYPLFIAFARTLSPDFWQWFVVLFQIALTALSLFCLSRLLLELQVRQLVGAFCLFSAGLSLSFTLDSMILTDSVVVSIFIIVLSENAVSSLRGNSMGLVQSLLFGVLLSIAFLFREGVAVLSLLFIVPLMVRVLLAPSHRFRSCVACLVFFLPLVLVSQIYLSWNEARTGYRFITTGGQTVYLQGLMDAARRDERIFSGKEAIDVTARKYARNYDFSEVLQIQKSLFQQGYSAPELATISKQKYFQTWAEYPLSMLRMTVGHVREKYAALTFRPLATLRETGFWVEGERPWRDYSVLQGAMFEDAGAFVLFVSESIERVVAIVITIAFVIIPVVWFVRLCRGGNLRREDVLVCCSLWVVYFGVMAAHALVHLEARYLAPVLPFSIVVGCFCLQSLICRKRGEVFTR